jgi:hypothetical protein
MDKIILPLVRTLEIKHEGNYVRFEEFNNGVQKGKELQRDAGQRKYLRNY